MKIKKWLAVLTLACTGLLSSPLTALAEDYGTPYDSPARTYCSGGTCTSVFYTVTVRRNADGSYTYTMTEVRVTWKVVS